MAHVVGLPSKRLNYGTVFSYASVLILSPRPQNNGKFCPGSSRLNQLCNTRPCPLNAVTFRAQQCAEYNSKPFRGWYYKWKPYTKVDGKVLEWLNTQHLLHLLFALLLLCIYFLETIFKAQSLNFQIVRFF